MNKEERDRQMKELGESVAENKRRREEFTQEGINLGQRLREKHTEIIDYPLEHKLVDGKLVTTKSEPRTMQDSDGLSTVLANMLNQIIEHNEEDDSAVLLSIEWAFEKFWGLQILDAMPMINDLYKRLIDGDHDKNNHYVYNDLDYSLWYEDIDVEKGRSWVDKRRAFCMDSQGRTSLILVEDWMQFSDDDIPRGTLTVLKVWPRIKRARWNKDHIEHLSLSYYRRNNFAIKYHDTRDEGAIFHFDNSFDPKVEWAWSRGGDISHFLWWWATSLETIKNDPKGM